MQTRKTATRLGRALLWLFGTAIILTIGYRLRDPLSAIVRPTNSGPIAAPTAPSARLEYLGAVLEYDQKLGGMFAKALLQNKSEGLARGIVWNATFTFFPAVLPPQMLEQRQDLLVGGQDWNDQLKDYAGEDQAKGGVYEVTQPHPDNVDQMTAFRNEVPNVRAGRQILYMLTAVKYLDNQTQRIVVSEACFMWRNDEREATKCGRQRIYFQ